MELEEAKWCFYFLQRKELSIDTFVSDRNKGVVKRIKQTQPKTSHFFEIWHVARFIPKKLFKASNSLFTASTVGMIKLKSQLSNNRPHQIINN